MTTEITKIEISSFVPYYVIKEDPMMWILRRNRVKLEAKRTVEFDLHNASDKPRPSVFSDILDELYEFCNANATGIWTYDTHAYIDESDVHPIHMSHHNYGMPQDRLMRGTLDVYFENREDRDLFMKNKILLMKLSN